jgi:hypothetical protein
MDEVLVGEDWYRYVNYPDGPDNTTAIYLDEWRVDKHTPKGVWISRYGMKKFVLNDARKRYAYPTIELAKKSFIARKQHQIARLRSQLEQAETALKLMQEGKLREDSHPTFWGAWGCDPGNASDPPAAQDDAS